MAKTIMIQGTMSNAGKSWLTAGLCRVFAQDGWRTVPFKAQNMALNSYITRDNLEIGRAQAMQAEAAGREPDVRMNPILLKPTTEGGSQVILNGEVAGTELACLYASQKAACLELVRRAYESLASENDIVVIEGAGSPAEINLLKNDIVNMGMAKLAKAPVLLAGDIDRGGVFAALYGTVMLLPEEERAYFKGLVVNKFRGDVELLRPGLAMLEARLSIPFVGVVPYAELDIDDEDGLSERLEARRRGDRLDIAVIRLPHLSNYTDFAPLASIPGAAVRYITKPAELSGADLAILPGTKNTIGDWRWVRETGLDAAVRRYADAGGPVVGICGGYQMLGNTLRDPLGVEEGGEAGGLGLIEADTVFGEQKQRRRVHGRFCGLEGLFAPLNGLSFEGYEMHMGRTRAARPAALVADSGGERPDGCSRGNVWGSYVHGLFDSEEVLRALEAVLLRRKGLSPGDEPVCSREEYKRREYDKLADLVRQSLDMEAVYRILDKGME